MFDMSRLGEVDVHTLGLEAACGKAYDAGLADAEGRVRFLTTLARAAGFQEGIEAGSDAVYSSFLDATTVKAVYRNGNYTILETADGEKTKVMYDPSYGYAYDEEKAFMAALLKRVTGNRYIDMIREFCPGSASRTGRDMIRRDADVSAPQDSDDDWREFLDSLSEDESGCNPGTGDVVPGPGPDMMADAFGDPDTDTDAEPATCEPHIGTDVPAADCDSGIADALQGACEPSADGCDPAYTPDAPFFQACE